MRVHVIERWSRHRARQFFDAFCHSLLDVGISDSEIASKLDELLADSSKSEIVFDAYRSVCFTKAKNLGPRVIALLTAELVAIGVKAEVSEESIFAAAEELSDVDLRDFSEFALDHAACAKKGSKKRATQLKDGSIEIQQGSHTTDSNWMSGEEVSYAPLDLAKDVGTWASKLKRLGLISDDVRERQWRYEEDSERHIDMAGTARETTWWLTLSPQSISLAKLISRARAHPEI